MVATLDTDAWTEINRLKSWIMLTCRVLWFMFWSLSTLDKHHIVRIEMMKWLIEQKTTKGMSIWVLPSGYSNFSVLCNDVCLPCKTPHQNRTKRGKRSFNAPSTHRMLLSSSWLRTCWWFRKSWGVWQRFAMWGRMHSTWIHPVIDKWMKHYLYHTSTTVTSTESHTGPASLERLTVGRAEDTFVFSEANNRRDV